MCVDRIGGIERAVTVGSPPASHGPACPMEIQNQTRIRVFLQQAKVKCLLKVVNKAAVGSLGQERILVGDVCPNGQDMPCVQLFSVARGNVEGRGLAVS